MEKDREGEGEMEDLAIYLFLETLKGLIRNSKLDLLACEKKLLESFENDIKYLREFIKKTPNKCSKVKELVTQIKDVVFEVENVVTQFEAEALKDDNPMQKLSYRLLCCFHIFPCINVLDFVGRRLDHHYLNLEAGKRKIGTLVAKAKLIYKKKMREINGAATLEHSPIRSGEGSGISPVSSNTSDEGQKKLVVGFEKEINDLLNLLHDSCKGLEIISIVGIAGGGKTTVAKEVYERPLTLQTFNIRAWVVVSQDYDKKTMKRDLLLCILKTDSQYKPEDYENSSDDTLAEKVLIYLKGKKYLIVLDDIWRAEDWHDIQRSFPRECEGSKVLLTSREPILDESICHIHRLPLLDGDSSWILLQNKVFGAEGCKKQELVDIGKQIAEKCGGLALAIVVIAGILKTQDKTLNIWEGVCQDLSSIFAQSSQGWMEILELSYKHLPLHLKACFLYIGGYPEDREIRVRDIIWLWIAEGFIQQDKREESLEVIANNYLRSLIDRSLVMEARKSLQEGIKACVIHDLLRQFCLRKANEEDFLLVIYMCHSSPKESSYDVNMRLRRLCIDKESWKTYCSKRPCPRNLRSFLCFDIVGNPYPYESYPELASFIAENKLLRILKYTSFVSDTTQNYGFNHQFEFLVHLRYLALHLMSYSNENSIRFLSCLLNLETLIFERCERKHIELRWDILKMVNLRHLYAHEQGMFHWHRFTLPSNYGSLKLDSLQTLKTMCACATCEEILIRAPNLKNLALKGWGGIYQKRLVGNGGTWMLPNLESHRCLEQLSLASFLGETNKGVRIRAGPKLPPTVTKLTLRFTHLRWEHLSNLLTALPNLEVLKLLQGASYEPVWDTSEVEWSSKIKYLRLENLDIKEWIAREDQFLKLEVLVLRCCFNLLEIPRNFGELNELREIEVNCCCDLLRDWPR